LLTDVKEMVAQEVRQALAIHSLNLTRWKFWKSLNSNHFQMDHVKRGTVTYMSYFTNIPTFSIDRSSKYIPTLGIFGLKINHLATPSQAVVSCLMRSPLGVFTRNIKIWLDDTICRTTQSVGQHNLLDDAICRTTQSVGRRNLSDDKNWSSSD
jgi:hypothetical protein